MSKISITIVGAGAVGTGLGLALRTSGARIVEVCSRRVESAQRLATLLGAPTRAVERVDDLSPESDVVLLATPDHAVASSAELLAETGQARSGRLFCHLSGFLTSEVLAPLERGGALVASVHPLQTFADPTGIAERLVGTAFVLEGSEEARERARAWVEKIGGRVYSLEAKAKPLYHAAAVFASNYLVALVAIAERCLQETAGPHESLPIAAMMPLVESTVRNLVRRGALHEALSGPLIRGDIAVVAGHLDALASKPDLDLLYRRLGLAILPLLAAAGRPARGRIEELRELLENEGGAP